MSRRHCSCRKREVRVDRTPVAGLHQGRGQLHQSVVLPAGGDREHQRQQQRCLMPMTTCLYSVLEVPSTASREEIRRAFRRLSMRLHPDQNSAAGAGKQFARVSEAYQVLGNSEKRRAYDAARAAQRKPAASRPGPRPVRPAWPCWVHYSPSAPPRAMNRPSRGGDRPGRWGSIIVY